MLRSVSGAIVLRRRRFTTEDTESTESSIRAAAAWAEGRSGIWISFWGRESRSLVRRGGLDFITTTAPNNVGVSLSLNKTTPRTKGAAMKIIGCDFHPSF